MYTRSGKTEVITMPLPLFGKEKAQEEKVSIAHTIAVASGKGGVGKSTVAVNLALALKERGYAVGLMDTDIYGPSVRRMLREDKMPSQIGERFLPAVAKGIRIISMAYFRQEHEAAVVRAPIANRIVAQFIHQVNWGKLDFLIIDFPPGTGDIQLTLSQQANIGGAVMVTTPQEVAVMDVKKAMHLFEQVRIPILGIIENMSGLQIGSSQEMLYPFGRGGGERLAAEAKVPFLGFVPIDPLLCQKADSGESIIGQDTPASHAFYQISGLLISRLQDQEGGQRFELMWKEMGDGGVSGQRP